jgi:hypothetical protein
VNIIPIIPNLALLLLLASGLLISRTWVVGIALGLLGILSSASIAVLASLLITVQAREPVMIALSMFALVVSMTFSLIKKSLPPPLEWLWVLVFFGFALISQIVSRVLGLSSVAFTDGHTIMRLGQAFQNGSEELLSGSQALKRGFALPALQSFGFEGEYLVGFMPIFFAGALILTVNLLWRLSPNRWVFITSTILVSAAIGSTEAILRHIYLMNTHAVAWLIIALLLLVTLDYLRGGYQHRQIIYVFVAFATVAFLRVDLVLLFSPFILSFILLMAPRSKWLAFAGLVSIAVPLWAWLSLAVKDFPFGGQAGPTILLLVGLGLGFVLILFQATANKPLDPLNGNLLLAPGAIVLVVTLVNTNVPYSLRSLFTNLFLGEGLWGFTFLAITVVTAGSLFVKKASKDPTFFRAAIRLFLSSLAIYLFSKYLDGVSAGSAVPGFSRVGFGDSLNRSLVSWLPFAVLPVIQLFSALFPTPVLGAKPSKDQVR